MKAAVKVFAENGFFQSTIAQIAKEAGVADGTIYLYFKNKDDILFKFYQHKINRIFERFRRALKKKGTAKDKLRHLIRTHLEEFEMDRNMAVVYQAEVHQNCSFGREEVRAMSRMYREIISEVVRLGQKEGYIRDDLSVVLVKRLINGAVDEVINAWIHSKFKYDLSSMADPLTDLFISGLAK